MPADTIMLSSALLRQFRQNLNHALDTCQRSGAGMRCALATLVLIDDKGTPHLGSLLCGVASPHEVAVLGTAALSRLLSRMENACAPQITSSTTH